MSDKIALHFPVMLVCLLGAVPATSVEAALIRSDRPPVAMEGVIIPSSDPAQPVSPDMGRMPQPAPYVVQVSS